jgi:hypothetical protein
MGSFEFHGRIFDRFDARLEEPPKAPGIRSGCTQEEDRQ